MHQPHKLALLVPRPSAEDYTRLRDDIAAHGLIDPIVLYHDQILDGITRAEVCDELGITPRYVVYKGTEAEAASFVCSKNLARRHLTSGQRSMLARKLLPVYEKEAKKRQIRKPESVTANRQEQNRGPTAAELAGKAVGVSGRSVARAKRIMDERPDLAAQVEAGTMTLNTAENAVIADSEPVRRANGGSTKPAKPSATKPPAKPRAWNGKSRTARRKEIRDEMKGNYSKLLNLQMEMTKLVAVISDWEPGDFELDQATLALVDSFYDDLITLGEWHDRAVLATQAWLGSVAVRKKIAALRDTKGRSDEEKETALRLAERLERKLEAQLPA